MRRFFYVSGLAVFLAGLLALVASAVLVTNGQFGAGILFWIGAATVLTGWMISSLAKNKTCRNCLHRVDAKALLCPHCDGVIV